MSTERRAAVHGLYAIADRHYLAPDRFVPAVQAALDGGAALIQYRDKFAGSKFGQQSTATLAPSDPVARGEPQGWGEHKLSDPESRTRIARELNRLCREHGVLFLINDDVELAAAVGASGVHLGRDDMDIASARQRLGADAIIGLSCYNDLARARTAAAAGADYVAFGRFFPSRTKPQAVPATLDLLRTARTELDIPIVAIGGITPENGATLLDAGADALAVIAGVFQQPDIRAAAARYAQLFATTNA